MEKFSPERAKATNDLIYKGMAERYAAAIAALAQMELKTKQTLDAAGVPTCMYVPYLDYARQLFRLSHGRQISGPCMAREAQVLLEKWAARTLNANVLAKIRSDVFDIPGPDT
jgi:hypothetical protein